jgi:AraC-like DNA-binding protein
VPIFSLDYFISTYSPVFKVEHDLKESSEALILEISKENSRHQSDEFITKLLFSLLFLKIMRERPRNNKIRPDERQIIKITQFLKLIEQNFTINRNASFYADKMGLSYKSLNLLSKKTSNKTAKQLIDSHTVLEAKRRLVIEKSQVKEIAYDLGFDEVTNFIKYFKRQTLLTPSQFKSNH